MVMPSFCFDGGWVVEDCDWDCCEDEDGIAAFVVEELELEVFIVRAVEADAFVIPLGLLAVPLFPFSENSSADVVRCPAPHCCPSYD